MPQGPLQQHGSKRPSPPSGAGMSWATLLYRFLFFDWLFVDMTSARSPAEWRAAWQHNRRQRRYLPHYLRRWSALTLLLLWLGMVCERTLSLPLVAAVLFILACIVLTGITVILVLWLRLASAELR